MTYGLDKQKVIFINIIVITIFSLIIVTIYKSSQKTLEERIQQSVSSELSKTSTAMLETLLQSVEELNAASAVVIFKQDVTLSEFQTYSKQQIRHMSEDFILEWQPIVLHKNREEFEQKARKQGLKNFHLWQPDIDGKPIPATKKDEYVPVYYLLSKNVDINTLGIDLAWSPERMASKLLARDQGVPKASDFFQVVTSQEKKYHPIGFAITYPVYKDGLIPDTVEKRKENIYGYLAGVYSISSLFSNLLSELNEKKLNFSVYSLGNENLVFNQKSGEDTLYKELSNIDVYGSKWEISLTASKEYIQKNYSNTKEMYLLLIQFVLGIIVIVILNLLYIKNKKLQHKTQEVMLFKNIVNSVNVGVSVSNASDGKDHQTIYINKALENISGYTQDEILGKNLRLLQGEDTDQPEIVIMSEAIKNQKSCQVEIRNYKKDGTLFYNFVSLHPMFNENGQLINYIGLQHDITERKLKEYKLISAKNALDTAVKIANLGEWELDLEKMEAYWSDEVFSILKLKRDKNTTYGPDFLQSLLYEDDWSEFQESINECITHGKDHQCIYRVKQENANPIWIQCRGRVYPEENKIKGVIQDITQFKEFEEQILKQKEEFESIFKYAGDGIAIIDLQGNFLKANQSFIDITGYDQEEILTKNCTELTSYEYKDINEKAIQDTIKNGNVEQIEKACISKDNSTFNVTMSMTLLPDKQSILLMIHDTTALKLLQEQAKLASLGEMIGNIAHQWRQPLNLITTSISGLRMQSELDEEITKADIVKYSDIINSQADYLSNTIDNFRDFIKSDLSYKDVNLNNVIENSITIVGAALKESFITLNTDIDDDIKVYGNSNELSQAFINIMNNAKDVLKENVKNEEDRLLFITANKIDSNSVEIIIKDSGGGIDEEIKDKIFEPYFTTKHAYVGTGLGLSMAYKIIVERHKGKVVANNITFEHRGKEYKGAVFTITLPQSLV